jgi:hypothetical protein
VLDVLDARDEESDSTLPRWPPPGSRQDQELKRLVKARLFELMAEAGLIVPEPNDP